MSGESETINPKYQIGEDGKVKVGDQELALDELAAGYLRQSDYTRKTQDLANQRAELQSAEKLMDNLQKNPAGTLKALASSLGVPLDQPVPVQQPQRQNDDWDGWDENQKPTAPAGDPRVDQLTQLVTGLVGEVRELRHGAATSSVQQEIAAVKAKFPGLEIDDQAVLRHATVNHIPTVDLAVKDLYDTDIMDLRLKEISAASEDQTIVDQKRAASQAVAAQAGASDGSTINSTPIPGGDEGLDVHDAIHAAMEELGVKDFRDIDFGDAVQVSY